MYPFAHTPAPQTTLWGTPQTTEQRLPGIWWVTTSSHAGLVLSDERQEAMHPALRVDGRQYEHHVNWSLVILAFDAEFAATGDKLYDLERDLAHQTAQHWRPQQYSAFTGKTLETRDSYVLRRIAATEKAIGQIGVRTAWGDHQDWVPTGKVGVYGQRIAACDHLGNAEYEGPEYRGLCDAARYDARAEVETFATLDVELLS